MLGGPRNEGFREVAFLKTFADGRATNNEDVIFFQNILE